MMGIPVDEPPFVLRFWDNQLVLANTTAVGSSSSINIEKEIQCITYHFVREGCAWDEWTMALSGEKRQRFVHMLLHHL